MTSPRPLSHRPFSSPLHCSPRGRLGALAALAMAFVLPFEAVTDAELLSYEPFNYTPGAGFAANPTATNATGFTGNFGFSGEDLGSAPGASTIGTGSLLYTDSALVTLANSGNHYENGHGRLSELFNTSLGGPFASYLEGANIGADGTTLYLSLEMQISSPSGYNGFELFRGTDSDPGRVLSINQWTGHGTANYFLTAGEANGGTFGGTPAKDANLGFTNTGVNFFVLKIEFGIGGNDTISIYANPQLGTQPAAPTGVVTASNLSFDRVVNSSFSGGSVQGIDEIRVGTSYASVTNVPEPTVVTLIAGGAMLLLRGRRRG